MKAFQAIRSALITGVLIVLPAWLAILLFLKVLVKLDVIVKPIAGQMPRGVDHPTIIALFTFLLICLIAGLLVNTAIGQVIGGAIHQTVLSRVPGYTALRSIAAQAGELETGGNKFQPALIEVEDGCLAPAFLVEEHQDKGLSTIFMPSVPTPMAGNIFIMPSSRVHPINVPLTTMMQSISKWGSGSTKLLEALPGEIPVRRDVSTPSTK